MTAPAQQPPEEPRSMRWGDLKKLINDTVSAAVSGGDRDQPQRQSLRDRTAPSQRGGNRSVDDEVRTAVEKLEADRKAREERAAKDKNYEDKIAALEERTKERAPVERRRVHKIMGWGEPT